MVFAAAVVLDIDDDNAETERTRADCTKMGPTVHVKEWRIREYRQRRVEVVNFSRAQPKACIKAWGTVPSCTVNVYSLLQEANSNSLEQRD